MDGLNYYYDKDHLTKKNLTYTEHLKGGLMNSFYLIIGGLGSYWLIDRLAGIIL